MSTIDFDRLVGDVLPVVGEPPAGRDVEGHDADRLVSGDTFVLDDPPGVPARWGARDEVFHAEGESLILYGPSGVGKTTLASRYVLASARGGELLGQPVARCERTLYIAADRPRQIARSFARMVTEADRELLRDRVVFWRGPPENDFARHPDTLTEMARRAGADRVIIDSLKDVALGLSDDEVGAGLNRAIQTALVEGIDIVALHHPRKASADNRRSMTLDDVYGSTWIAAGAGSVVLLWGKPGDPIVELRHPKQPAAEIGPLRLLHDQTTGTITIADQVDAFAVLTANPGITAADLARILFDTETPTPNEREKARRRLNDLVTRNLAHREDGHRGGRSGGAPARYYLVDHARAELS